jgi:NADH:ubiquinone oxidoreductase subunit K
MNTQYYLILAGALFSIGLALVATKRHAIVVLMGIELMLNAANINLVAFSQTDNQIRGQFFAIFIIVIAAAEAVVALALVLNVFRHFNTVNIDQINSLKG